MTKEDYAIYIEALEKSYKAVKVLDGIDLKIKQGSIFCLLGANGAGKTTIIKILSTLLPADKGAAYICGKDVSREAGKVRELISLTGQYAAVDGLLTGRENLIMAAKLFHLKNPKERADELLKKVGLHESGNKKVSAYSGGMRRRLDIAMSLTAEPKVIFLDEPTTGLDPQSRIELWGMVKQLAKTGITIFLTTQYLEEAEQLADHIAVLHGGKIVKEGSPEELKNIVSESRVILNFENATDLSEAEQKLIEYKTEKDSAALALTVTADDNIKSFVGILTLLNGINVSKAEQRKANLEDVFLKLTGGGNGKEN